MRAKNDGWDAVMAGGHSTQGGADEPSEGLSEGEVRAKWVGRSSRDTPGSFRREMVAWLHLGRACGANAGSAEGASRQGR